MARITSSLFVSAMLRRVQAEGGFASVVRRGESEAGAVHIALRGRNGGIELYSPAPQTDIYGDEQGLRKFMQVPEVTDDASLGEFAERELRFDTDFWLIELEPAGNSSQDLFPVTTP